MPLDAGGERLIFKILPLFLVVDLVSGTKSGMQLLFTFRSHLVFHLKLGHWVVIGITGRLDPVMSKEIELEKWFGYYFMIGMEGLGKYNRAEWVV